MDAGSYNDIAALDPCGRIVRLTLTLEPLPRPAPEEKIRSTGRSVRRRSGSRRCPMKRNLDSAMFRPSRRDAATNSRHPGRPVWYAGAAMLLAATQAAAFSRGAMHAAHRMPAFAAAPRALCVNTFETAFCTRSGAARVAPATLPPRRGAFGLRAQDSEGNAAPSMARPLIYDTTLTQRQAEMNPEDRMKLVERLREFGLDMIEGGWPTVFPLDRVFFERASTALPQEARRALVAMAPAPSAADAADVAAELLASGAGHVGLALSALGGDQEWASPELLAGATAGITALAAGLDDAKDRHVIVHVHNAFEAWRADAPRLQKLLAELAGAGAGALLLVDSGRQRDAVGGRRCGAGAARGRQRGARRRAPRRCVPRRRGGGGGAPPPPPPPSPPRTNRTRRVPHPVLIGHAASLTPY